jgi:hypothetical protein
VTVAGAEQNVVVRYFSGNAALGVKLGELLGAEGETLGGLRLEYVPNYVRLTSPTALVAFFEHKQVEHTLRLRAPFADERVEAHLEGTYGYTDFDSGIKDDNIIGRIRGGITWKVAERRSSIGELVIAARLGQEWRDYRRHTGTVAFDEDWNGLVGDLNAAWKPWKQHTFSAGGAVLTEESTITNFQRTLRFVAGWSWEFAEDWRLQVQGVWDQVHQSRPSAQHFYHRRQLEISVTRELHPNILGEASFMYRDKATNDDLGEYDDYRVAIGATINF